MAIVVRITFSEAANLQGGTAVILRAVKGFPSAGHPIIVLMYGYGICNGGTALYLTSQRAQGRGRGASYLIRCPS